MAESDRVGSEGPGRAGPPWEVPEVVWAPLAVGALLGAAGLIGLAAGRPWLFPSLGPTAYIEAEEPAKPAARFYNTVAGHLIGLAGGVLAVLILGAEDVPGVLASKELAPVRVGAAALAGVLTMIGLTLARAAHPPAAATMLLVALGGIDPTWRDAGTVLAGALIVATLGEGVRSLRRHVFVAPPAAPPPPRGG